MGLKSAEYLLLKRPYTELSTSFRAPARTGSECLIASLSSRMLSYISVASPRARSILIREGYMLPTSASLMLLATRGLSGAPWRPPRPNTKVQPYAFIFTDRPLPVTASMDPVMSSHMSHTADGISSTLRQYLAGTPCFSQATRPVSPRRILADNVVVFHLAADVRLSSGIMVSRDSFVSKYDFCRRLKMSTVAATSCRQ